MIRSKTTLAIPPGETIKEMLEERCMSQKEFAARMNVSEKHMSRLVHGDVILTPEMALRLEMVLGVSAHFWNNLESIYREKILLVQQENGMEDELEILDCFPYEDMASYQWVKDVDTMRDRVIELRKFFEVSSLTLIKEPLIPSIVYKKTDEKYDYSLMAWAQKAKLEARKVDTKPIDTNKLKRILPNLKKNKSTVSSKLTDCGIVVVELPDMGCSFTFKDKKKIVVGMADRNNFWACLYHELDNWTESI